VAEGYKAIAADKEREREATEWVENLTGDIAVEPDRPSRWNDPSLGREMRKTVSEVKAHPP